MSSGIHDPDVSPVSLGEGKRFGPVVAEIAPGPFVKLALNAKAGHMAADRILGGRRSDPVSTITHEVNVRARPRRAPSWTMWASFRTIMLRQIAGCLLAGF